MSNEKSSKDLRREELFDQLCRSLEGGNSKMHVVYVNPEETKKEAEKRYCAETGSFIGDSDVVLLVIYDDHLQPDG